jgi:hypothetical protein
MAMKSSIGFSMDVVGDGAATSITVTVASAPIIFQFPLVHTSDQASSKFDITALTVTNLLNLVSTDGQTITGSVGLLGTTLTFTWPIAVTNNTKIVVYGDLVF